MVRESVATVATADGEVGNRLTAGQASRLRTETTWRRDSETRDLLSVLPNMIAFWGCEAARLTGST